MKVTRPPRAITVYSCMSLGAPALYVANQDITIIEFVVRIEIVVPACENPKLMNRWCRWVLSGWNGDVPLKMRENITLIVSKTGIASTASTNAVMLIPVFE